MSVTLPLLRPLTTDLQPRQPVAFTRPNLGALVALSEDDEVTDFHGATPSPSRQLVCTICELTEEETIGAMRSCRFCMTPYCGKCKRENLIWTRDAYSVCIECRQHQKKQLVVLRRGPCDVCHGRISSTSRRRKAEHCAICFLVCCYQCVTTSLARSPKMEDPNALYCETCRSLDEMDSEIVKTSFVSPLSRRRQSDTLESGTGRLSSDVLGTRRDSAPSLLRSDIFQSMMDSSDEEDESDSNDDGHHGNSDDIDGGGDDASEQGVSLRHVPPTESLTDDDDDDDDDDDRQRREKQQKKVEEETTEWRHGGRWQRSFDDRGSSDEEGTISSVSSVSLEDLANQTRQAMTAARAPVAQRPMSSISALEEFSSGPPPLSDTSDLDDSGLTAESAHGSGNNDVDTVGVPPLGDEEGFPPALDTLAQSPLENQLKVDVSSRPASMEALLDVLPPDVFEFEVPINESHKRAQEAESEPEPEPVSVPETESKFEREREPESEPETEPVLDAPSTPPSAHAPVPEIPNVTPAAPVDVVEGSATPTADVNTDESAERLVSAEPDTLSHSDAPPTMTDTGVSTDTDVVPDLMDPISPRRPSRSKRRSFDKGTVQAFLNQLADSPSPTVTAETTLMPSPSVSSVDDATTTVVQPTQLELDLTARAKARRERMRKRTSSVELTPSKQNNEVVDAWVKSLLVDKSRSPVQSEPSEAPSVVTSGTEEEPVDAPSPAGSPPPPPLPPKKSPLTSPRSTLIPPKNVAASTASAAAAADPPPPPPPLPPKALLSPRQIRQQMERDAFVAAQVALSTSPPPPVPAKPSSGLLRRTVSDLTNAVAAEERAKNAASSSSTGNLASTSADGGGSEAHPSAKRSSSDPTETQGRTTILSPVPGSPLSLILSPLSLITSPLSIITSPINDLHHRVRSTPTPPISPTLLEPPKLTSPHSKSPVQEEATEEEVVEKETAPPQPIVQPVPPQVQNVKASSSPKFRSRSGRVRRTLQVDTKMRTGDDDASEKKVRQKQIVFLKSDSVMPRTMSDRRRSMREQPKDDALLAEKNSDATAFRLGALLRQDTSGSELGYKNIRIPNGWEEQRLPTGEPYYIDHHNRTTSWIDPRAKQGEGLPFGWAKIEDAVLGTYFLDHINHKCTYEKPHKPSTPRAPDHAPTYSTVLKAATTIDSNASQGRRNDDTLSCGRAITRHQAVVRRTRSGHDGAPMQATVVRSASGNIAPMMQRAEPAEAVVSASSSHRVRRVPSVESDSRRSSIGDQTDLGRVARAPSTAITSSVPSLSSAVASRVRRMPSTVLSEPYPGAATTAATTTVEEERNDEEGTGAGFYSNEARKWRRAESANTPLESPLPANAQLLQGLTSPRGGQVCATVSEAPLSPRASATVVSPRATRLPVASSRSMPEDHVVSTAVLAVTLSPRHHRGSADASPSPSPSSRPHSREGRRRVSLRKPKLPEGWSREYDQETGHKTYVHEDGRRSKTRPETTPAKSAGTSPARRPSGVVSPPPPPYVEPQTEEAAQRRRASLMRTTSLPVSDAPRYTHNKPSQPPPPPPAITPTVITSSSPKRSAHRTSSSPLDISHHSPSAALASPESLSPHAHTEQQLHQGRRKDSSKRRLPTSPLEFDAGDDFFQF